MHRLSYVLASLVLFGCGSASPDREHAVEMCESWARTVRSTSRIEDDEHLAATARLQGHCTVAEDRIISTCTYYGSTDAEEARLIALSEDYERACDGALVSGNERSWRPVIEEVSRVFDALVEELDEPG